jgi:Flp pilus assembly protein CpaB
MPRRRASLLLTTVGLVMIVAVGITVYSTVSEAQQVRASLPTTRVVVATSDVPARTEIASSMVNVLAVPNELVQVGAATRVEDVVGKFNPEPILKGEVLNVNKIGPLSAKNAPSYRIEKGKVMYVLPVSFAGSQFSVVQVNALRPGDRVDLLYTAINAPPNLNPEERDRVQNNPIPYLQTRIMLQALRIQEIGSYAADGTLVPATGDPASKSTVPTLENANIIFIVDPEEALVLKWLKDSATYYKDSNIEMVLRAPADEDLADTNILVDFEYMRQKYGLAAPPSSLAAATR